MTPTGMRLIDLVKGCVATTWHVFPPVHESTANQSLFPSGFKKKGLSAPQRPKAK
jgi:hypothetical protein